MPGLCDPTPYGAPGHRERTGWIKRLLFQSHNLWVPSISREYYPSERHESLRSRAPVAAVHCDINPIRFARVPSAPDALVRRTQRLARLHSSASLRKVLVDIGAPTRLPGSRRSLRTLGRYASTCCSIITYGRFCIASRKCGRIGKLHCAIRLPPDVRAVETGYVNWIDFSD